MGKKVNPKIFRIGINRTWPSTWFAVGKKYRSNLKQEVPLRRFILNELKEAGIDLVKIERDSKKITIEITAAKPGVLIGRGGAGLEDLKKKIHDRFLKNFRLGEININIKECGRPNLSAPIIVQSVIDEIEKRMPFKRVMKQAIARVEKAGALGIRMVVSGRLNGAEIAREEKLVSGKVPLQTLRADIDYSRGTAKTSYGTIGVKVWIYKGDVFGETEPDKKGEVVGNRKPMGGRQ